MCSPSQTCPPPQDAPQPQMHLGLRSYSHLCPPLPMWSLPMYYSSQSCAKDALSLPLPMQSMSAFKVCLEPLLLLLQEGLPDYEFPSEHSCLPFLILVPITNKHRPWLELNRG